jgi:hypothetical protein|tara:strand:- start:90 stop:257 length:168 start_codon:yes stop_codon:yes gene_type:complete
MNTYNIEYKGITVLTEIPKEDLKRMKESIKGFLYLQGSMTLRDIEAGLKVKLNKV